MDWYYQHLPCDDWDQDFVQERTLIDTVVNPDPDSVMWINPAVAESAQERKVVVTLGEPGGLFVNDRETGEFLWATPLPYTSTERFGISMSRRGRFRSTWTSSRRKSASNTSSADTT